VVAVGLLGVPAWAAGTASSAIPLADDGKFLVGLSAPVLAPGTSGTVAVTLTDPLATALATVTLSFGYYAFNAYPGNATGPVPNEFPSLTEGGVTGRAVTTTLASLAPGASVPVVIAVSAPSDSPSGTYALRSSLTFSLNGTAETLESRGFFSDQVWSQATTGPNGTSQLNLTTLGVAGVIPETAVLVRANPFPLPAYALLGAAVVLAATGGYLAYRRGPGSSAGATAPADPSQAPTALGKRRKSAGDWRKS
jgi:hypothetical protein